MYEPRTPYSEACPYTGRHHLHRPRQPSLHHKPVPHTSSFYPTNKELCSTIRTSTASACLASTSSRA
jgi:hypothetical protein